jgi:hypothetical protein
MITGIANIEIIDILDKVFLCLSHAPRSEVFNGATTNERILSVTAKGT